MIKRRKEEENEVRMGKKIGKNGGAHEGKRRRELIEKIGKEGKD